MNGCCTIVPLFKREVWFLFSNVEGVESGSDFCMIKCEVTRRILDKTNDHSDLVWKFKDGGERILKGWWSQKQIRKEEWRGENN